MSGLSLAWVVPMPDFYKGELICVARRLQRVGTLRWTPGQEQEAAAVPPEAGTAAEAWSLPGWILVQTESLHGETEWEPCLEALPR